MGWIKIPNTTSYELSAWHLCCIFWVWVNKTALWSPRIQRTWNGKIIENFQLQTVFALVKRVWNAHAALAVRLVFLSHKLHSMPFKEDYAHVWAWRDSQDTADLSHSWKDFQPWQWAKLEESEQKWFNKKNNYLECKLTLFHHVYIKHHAKKHRFNTWLNCL